MSFEQFELDATIMAGVYAQGYTAPTPIQAEAIAPIRQGSDVMGLAQTGTGKTAAFVLPLLQRLLSGPRGRTRVLVLAPTRELTEQTNMVVRQLGCRTRLRSTSIYGGVSMQGQLRDLRKGVEIVAACPGRLLDIISRNAIDLSRVETLVLDEADRMFDMGFLPDVKKILKVLPRERQTLLFSATMPRELQSVADAILRRPVKISIGHTAPAETVTHTFYRVAMDAKTELLRELIATTTTRSILVFARTKSRVKRLARQLGQTGLPVAELHGDMSQNKRQRALDGFRTGRASIMVATDVAARGIDVTAVSHVINYDMPDTVDAYTHRIGRTGRACATGDAFTFVTADDRGLVLALQRVLGDRLQYAPGQSGGMPAAVAPRTPRARRSGYPRPFAAKHGEASGPRKRSRAPVRAA